jgi:septal ring factor EnvC (AmiA/AmiB activator)
LFQHGGFCDGTSTQKRLQICLVFLVALVINAVLVYLFSGHELLNRQSELNSFLESIQAAEKNQAQDIGRAQTEIEEIRVAGEREKATLQTIQKELTTHGGKPTPISKEVESLLKSNEDVLRTAQEQTVALKLIQFRLAETTARLQQIHDKLAQSGRKP